MFCMSPSVLLLILQLCQQYVRINKISSRMLISSSFSLFPPLTYNNVGQRSTLHNTVTITSTFVFLLWWEVCCSETHPLLLLLLSSVNYSSGSCSVCMETQNKWSGSRIFLALFVVPVTLPLWHKLTAQHSWSVMRLCPRMCVKSTK